MQTRILRDTILPQENYGSPLAAGTADTGSFPQDLNPVSQRGHSIPRLSDIPVQHSEYKCVLCQKDIRIRSQIFNDRSSFSAFRAESGKFPFAGELRPFPFPPDWMHSRGRKP